MSATRDRGQAAVEFAIALPVVVVLVLGVVQVVVVVRDQLALELAARDGARAASVAADPAAAASAAAQAATALSPLDVTTRSNGPTVTVEVVHRSDTDVPIIGAVMPSVDLRASVTMRREPP